MSVPALGSADIAEYLKTHEHKDLLRFITCGSVDDGKSTLIGRLLYEAGLLFEDQLLALELESRLRVIEGDRLPARSRVAGVTASLCCRVGGRGPLLVAPAVDPAFQLYVLRSGIPLLQGLSGRAPANVDLLDSMFSGRLWTERSLAEVLDLTRAPAVAAVDPRWVRELSSSPLLEPEGCFEQFDRSVCLFHPRTVPDGPGLRLDRDAQWEHGASPAGWPLAQLRSQRSGALDYATLGRCRLRESTGFGRISLTRELIFPGAQLRGARFEGGEVMFAERVELVAPVS